MAKIFKSVWFRCIAVLLALTVILGGTIAVLNFLWAVSPEERTARAIKKIYGTEMDFTPVIDTDQEDQPIIYYDQQGNELSRINKVYNVGSDVLCQAQGSQGYKGGTITLWIKVVEKDNGNKTIDKVVLENYEKQTLMSKLDGTFYSGFYVDITQAYNNGQLFSPTDSDNNLTNPITGATKSANAACNAINAVIKYVGGER